MARTIKGQPEGVNCIRFTQPTHSHRVTTPLTSVKVYNCLPLSLTSLQTRLIKTGGRLVLHARRLVFQLAEVLVTREMLTGILERISRLRLAPG